MSSSTAMPTSSMGSAMLSVKQLQGRYRSLRRCRISIASLRSQMGIRSGVMGSLLGMFFPHLFPSSFLPHPLKYSPTAYAGIPHYLSFFVLALIKCNSKGRYQASLVVKLLVSQFIIRYEMRLEDPNAKRQWIWESFNLPYENTKIVFTERKTYGKARKARADSHVAL